MNSIKKLLAHIFQRSSPPPETPQPSASEPYPGIVIPDRRTQVQKDDDLRIQHEEESAAIEGRLKAKESASQDYSSHSSAASGTIPAKGGYGTASYEDQSDAKDD